MTDLMQMVKANHSDHLAIEELCYRGREVVPILPIAYAEFENPNDGSYAYPGNTLTYALSRAVREVPEISGKIDSYLLSSNTRLVMRALIFFELAQSNLSTPPKELSGLLKHKEWQVRLKAAFVLIRVNPTLSHLAFQTMIESYGSKDIPEKLAAAEILIEHLRESFGREIVKLLNDSNDTLVKGSLNILSYERQLDHEAVAVALIRTLNRRFQSFDAARCTAIFKHIDLRGFFGYLHRYRPIEYVELTDIGKENADHCAAFLFEQRYIYCDDLTKELHRWDSAENPRVRKIMTKYQCK